MLRIAIIFLIFIFGINSLYSEEPNFDSKLYKEFQSTAPVCWSNYIKSLSKVEGTLITRTLENDILITEQKNNYHLLFPYNIKEYNEDKKQLVRCAGIKYLFSLEKEIDTQDWQIKQLLFYENNEPTVSTWEKSLSNEILPENLLERNFRFILFELGQGIQLYGNTYLPFLTTLPEFSIKSIYRDSVNDCIRMDYEFEPINPEKYETISVRSGSLTFDNNSWLIKEGVFDVLLSGTRLRCTIQCDYEKNEIPILKKKILSTFHKNVNYSSIFEYDIKINNNIDSRIFTLSHYGIPEPDFDNSRRTNRVRYIFMGLGAIMIGIALWRIIQKRRGRM
jgi:hypothetical protein